jgi:hypothetical protein
MSFFFVVRRIEKKMSEKNWIILFYFLWEKKKCRKNKKKISCVKKEEKKKSGDSFRDIIRKKNCQWWELCIKQRMLQKRGEVVVSGLRRIGEWSRHEQWLMIVCAMSARIRELATLWDVLLEVCEDHEKMWCGATWKKCGVEPRCECESHIYMTWRVR